MAAIEQWLYERSDVYLETPQGIRIPQKAEKKGGLTMKKFYRTPRLLLCQQKHPLQKGLQNIIFEIGSFCVPLNRSETKAFLQKRHKENF